MLCYCDAVNYALQRSANKPNPHGPLWNGRMTSASPNLAEAEMKGGRGR
jgi:hypothetical protein